MPTDNRPAFTEDERLEYVEASTLYRGNQMLLIHNLFNRVCDLEMDLHDIQENRSKNQELTAEKNEMLMRRMMLIEKRMDDEITNNKTNT